VRRDLRVLAESGQVELVYGGATLRRPVDYSFRSKELATSKPSAPSGGWPPTWLATNEQIFLDSGTTCFEMIPYLKSRGGFHHRSARRGWHWKVIAGHLDHPAGGQYRPDRMDTAPAGDRHLEHCAATSASSAPTVWICPLARQRPTSRAPI